MQMKLFNIGAIALKVFPLVLPMCPAAQGIHITPGAHLVVNGVPSLVFNNASIVNDGEFSAGNGSLLFTGDSASMARPFIGGGASVAFYNLVVDRGAGDLLMNNNIAVAGKVILNRGNLQLNNFVLDLGGSGSIEGERANSCITGVNGGIITLTTFLNAPRAINPGNIGVEITSEANLGYTVINRGHLLQSGENGIQRYFDITPQLDGPASLRFFYLEGELAGKGKGQLAVFSGRAGESRLSLRGKDGSDPTANWVLKRNVGLSQRWTLAVDSKRASFGEGGTVVYPNPVRDAFDLRIVRDNAGSGVIYLYDGSGHLLEQKKVYWQAGVNTIGWDIGRYSRGVFYLSVDGRIDGAIKIVRQ